MSANNTLNMFKFDRNSVAFSAGTTIFEQDDAATVMYVIQSGEVEILINDQLIETVGPGGFFGEMALVDSSPRSGKAVAKSDCQLVPIDENSFLNHVHATPFFALQVMRELVHRIRHLNEAVTD